MGKWYGNLTNRVIEAHADSLIEVGTRATETHWSDRDVWETVAVRDQKHVTVRRMIANHIGGPFENKWEMVSDENGAVMDLTKRGKYWYQVMTITEDELEAMKAKAADTGDFGPLFVLTHWGFDFARIHEKGKQTKMNRVNITFGVDDYHYDFEF